MHRRFGTSATLIRTATRAGEVFLEVRFEDALETIPQWMCCREECHQHTFGHDPIVAWQRLNELADFCQRHSLHG
jgi:hypothetical protein